MYILVSSSGFTRPAIKLARDSGIGLRTYRNVFSKDLVAEWSLVPASLFVNESGLESCILLNGEGVEFQVTDFSLPLYEHRGHVFDTQALWTMGINSGHRQIMDTATHRARTVKTKGHFDSGWTFSSDLPFAPTEAHLVGTFRETAIPPRHVDVIHYQDVLGERELAMSGIYHFDYQDRTCEVEFRVINGKIEQIQLRHYIPGSRVNFGTPPKQVPPTSTPEKSVDR